MDFFRKLQHDLTKGRLTEGQFNEVLKGLKLDKKAKTQRPRNLTSQDHRRRTRLRLITKWVFDVELDRASTPLYLTQDETSLVLPVFFKLANQVIKYAESDPIVAASTHEELTDSIHEIVKNRHKNLKDSKKPKKDGTANVPMKTIYKKKRQMMVTLKTGEQLVLQPPLPLPLPTVKTQPLPLPKATASPALPAITSPPPELSPSMVSAPVKTKSNPVPPVPTTTGSCEDDDSDFDILDLQEKIQEMQKRIEAKKKQKKPAVVVKPWLDNMVMAMTNVKPMQTCRNAECGREFVVEVAEDQHGDPVLCNSCWEKAKEDLQSITSQTGAKRSKKRKPTKKENKVDKKCKKSKKVTPPQSPKSSAVLKRTETPPQLTLKTTKSKFNTKRNIKFKVFHV